MNRRLGSFIAIVGAAMIGHTCAAAGMVAGADISELGYCESQGAVYRDGGQAEDAIAILKKHGLTCVRLRLFTSSDAQVLRDPCNYINNLDYTVPLAVRVKKAGLQFMLDFHYSDTWADPGKQAKPSAWTNLTFAALVEQMRQYNSNSIAAFAAAGAMPDYVQVGNEIISGMLWPDGAVGGAHDTPAQWAQLGQLMKAAIEGIHDAAGARMPKIVVHIDRGGSWAGTEWFFDNLIGQGVPFDIIGQSYYPALHGSLEDLQTCLTNAAQRYGKPIFVAETSFPWASSFGRRTIVGFAPSVTGQVDYVTALGEIVKSVPGGNGAGVFWWGAAYQTNATVGRLDAGALFDRDGNVLPAVSALGNLADGQSPQAAPAEGAPVTHLSNREIQVRDPSTIAKCKDEYWVFGTGEGITTAHSEDLVKWEDGPRVFTNLPAAVAEAVPGHKGNRAWAPDIIHLGDRYLLYYAVSTWGKNTSAIGLATNPTLDPDDPRFRWTDQGIVVQSREGDDFNAIDPAITQDAQGGLWLAFGSYWSGIKLVSLDPTTGQRFTRADTKMYPLAHADAIEASYIYHRGGWYYLFVDWGQCCRGTNSTYNIRIGRSEKIAGPYVDKDGKDMLQGGGSLFLGSEGAFIGPGHAGIVSDGKTEWFSCHFYDGNRGGMPTLGAGQVEWGSDGWPRLVPVRCGGYF
ncbi:MAG TPA: glycosyl hydrolase 53 family protein [Verrucomicrobiae bacterium]|nr:glycosyl hydrolase 53 family protein [Verrucomicrobiae bacterium]